MQKQMKLITTGKILGLFLVANYIFDILSKIGASLMSAVISQQLPAEAWNSELYSAVAKQSLPFVLMILAGTALLSWSDTKDKALAMESSQWAESAPGRKELELAVVGALLAVFGFFNIFLPVFMGFEDLMMAFASPEGVDYITKMILPNFAVLLVQMLVGIWMIIGVKTKRVEAPVLAATEEVNEECAESHAHCNNCDAQDQETEAVEQTEPAVEEEKAAE